VGVFGAVLAVRPARSVFVVVRAYKWRFMKINDGYLNGIKKISLQLLR